MCHAIFPPLLKLTFQADQDEVFPAEMDWMDPINPPAVRADICGRWAHAVTYYGIDHRHRKNATKVLAQARPFCVCACVRACVCLWLRKMGSHCIAPPLIRSGYSSPRSCDGQTRKEVVGISASPESVAEVNVY